MTIFKKQYFFSFYVVSFMESDDKRFSYRNRFSLRTIIKEKEKVNFHLPCSSILQQRRVLWFSAFSLAIQGMFSEAEQRIQNSNCCTPSVKDHPLITQNL